MIIVSKHMILESRNSLSTIKNDLTSMYLEIIMRAVKIAAKMAPKMALLNIPHFLNYLNCAMYGTFHLARPHLQW